MQPLKQVRRARLRQYVADHGGPTSVAKALGYSNGSFLSQLIGPNPSRDFSEKVARDMEDKLNLSVGYLDNEGGTPTPGYTLECVRTVATVAQRNKVVLAPDQLANLVALAGQRLLPSGVVDEALVEGMVAMLKK
jgi:hypothetical protein